MTVGGKFGVFRLWSMLCSEKCFPITLHLQQIFQQPAHSRAERHRRNGLESISIKFDTSFTEGASQARSSEKPQKSVMCECECVNCGLFFFFFLSRVQMVFTSLLSLQVSHLFLHCIILELVLVALFKIIGTPGMDSQEGFKNIRKRKKKLN